MSFGCPHFLANAASSGELPNSEKSFTRTSRTLTYVSGHSKNTGLGRKRLAGLLLEKKDCQSRGSAAVDFRCKASPARLRFCTRRTTQITDRPRQVKPN